MTKRSLFLSVAAGLLTSVAFATPSQAGTTTVVTDISFVVSTGGPATDVEVTYSPTIDPITPASSLAITQTGGLSGLAITELSPNTVEVTFTGANATVGNLEFSFQTNSSGPFLITAGLSPATVQFTLSAGVKSFATVPEPTSIALLGIGMTGFLAFRRLFKRTAVA